MTMLRLLVYAGVLIGLVALWPYLPPSSEGFVEIAAGLSLVVLGVMLANAVTSILRQRNSRVVVSGKGLECQDLLRRRRFIPWEDIIAVVWTRTVVLGENTCTLSLHVHEEGYIMPVDIAHCHGREAAECVALRDEIAERRGLAPAKPVPPGFWERASTLFLGTAQQRMWK